MKKILIILLLLNTAYASNTNMQKKQADIYDKILQSNQNANRQQQKTINSQNEFTFKRLTLLKKLNKNQKDAIFQKNWKLLTEYNSLERCLLFSKRMSNIEHCKREFLKD